MRTDNPTSTARRPHAGRLTRCFVLAAFSALFAPLQVDAQQNKPVRTISRDKLTQIAVNAFFEGTRISPEQRQQAERIYEDYADAHRALNRGASDCATKLAAAVAARDSAFIALLSTDDDKQRLKK